jgi:hypothetical protein
MSDENKVLRLAEEMAASRHNIDATLVMIRSSLVSMREKMSQAIEEVETRGSSADLAKLGSLHDQGSAVDELVKRLSQQKIYMDQAMTFIKLIQVAR